MELVHDYLLALPSLRGLERFHLKWCTLERVRVLLPLTQSSSLAWSTAAVLFWGLGGSLILVYCFNNLTNWH